MINNINDLKPLSKISIRKFKLCDITGLPARYEDPRSGLYFYDASVYEYIMALKPSEREKYYKLNRYERKYK
ncbi:hypothetical protein EHP00_2071 [Ecytonucleospora hepatopenaei]|uniref:Vps72/YL1 C-terminal domain-containing protein n=1 Tax=Ecytonucleospora hepatopenaei TaxID=646526 RepID=A0A1W0E2Y8_9MICR|nr:hypothetical protein EHP00_2071 [Ecytonucleospora hepatopenaei]